MGVTEAKREYNRKWAEEHPDQRREARKRYYWANRDKEIQQSLDWGKANPDKVREIDRRYKAKHRKILNEKQKAYRLRNHSKVIAAEQLKTRVYRARRAKAKSDEHTLAELHRYWRDRGIDPKRCTYCDAWYTKWGHDWKHSQGDHVVPLHRGGTDTMDNMMPCCWSCNASKSDRILYAEWTPPNMREAT